MKVNVKISGPGETFQGVCNVIINALKLAGANINITVIPDDIEGYYENEYQVLNRNVEVVIENLPWGG